MCGLCAWRNAIWLSRCTGFLLDQKIVPRLFPPRKPSPGDDFLSDSDDDGMLAAYRAHRIAQMKARAPFPGRG